MLTIRTAQVNQIAAASPGVQMVQPCEDTNTWVEVRLIDEDDEPVAGAYYKVQLPDGSIMTGNLDEDGKVRFDSIVPGTCKVSFPEIHAKEWVPA